MIICREIFADNVQHNTVLKQFFISRIGNKNHVDIWVNHNILSQHSVIFETSRTLFHPNLITVSIGIILCFLMSCGGYFHPVFRYQLLIFPVSFLQVKLTQLCHIFCTDK